MISERSANVISGSKVQDSGIYTQLGGGTDDHTEERLGLTARRSGPATGRMRRDGRQDEDTQVWIVWIHIHQQRLGCADASTEYRPCFVYRPAQLKGLT